MRRGVPELVVGQVARQVQARVSDARVLPVDSHEPTVRADQVQVVQVVVAESRNELPEGGGDAPPAAQETRDPRRIG